ncbi:TPA: hypothetical protein DIC38_00495 [Candidatus Nomurabacteria bacterium]|nr:MAG: MnlI restriction endonuclease [Parcubacteria bacterium RAAC4_OD1_1]HCY26150.1 hypothetical protein [Candidatus Nomurabacteria bacterium]
MININQLLNKPIETLLAVFFNTTKNKENNFEVCSRYRQTKFAKLPKNSYEQTAISLSNKYKLNFNSNGKGLIISIINNNHNYDLNDFLNVVYDSIVVKLNKLPSNYLLDVEIALALFMFRGSVDFNRSFYSVDLKNPTKDYIDNFFKVLLSSDDLLSRLNLNFRELQPQYVEGRNLRNTQVRINLKWFYDNVILNFSNINKYKTDIFFKNIAKLGEIRKYNIFEERIILYKQSIFGRKLNKNEINKLRNELQFSLNDEQTKGNKFSIRNQKIVSYAREIFNDVCVGCNYTYNIKDRSFKMPRNDRYYFEINHVIAYSSDSVVVDVLDNLVKLCPTCHRALTPGRAYEELQKTIIKNMLNSRKEVSRFVDLMKPKEFKSSIDYVYKMLK